MPGYNTHRLFNYTAFIVASAIICMMNLPFLNLVQFIVLGAGFFIGTEFITPDLDIESTVIKRWGVLGVIWLPYQFFFKHGRSSHNIVYGAIVRLLYIGIIILGVYYLLFRTFPSNMSIIQFDLVLLSIAGLIIANALHVILDMMI